MDDLLRIDFVNHHTLPACTIIVRNVNFEYFEIDDEARVLKVNEGITNGMAKYQNPEKKTVKIIDYDNFLTSTPHSFQHGKKRCDVILHTTSDSSHFILNELKDRIPVTNVLITATEQLIATLNVLHTVPSIVNYINTFTIKKCYYCNKQSTAPAILSVTTAFNTLSTLSSNGFKLPNTDIENFGFELWEISGNQTIILN